MASHSATGSVQIPPHVPAELRRDFDIFHFISPSQDVFEAYHGISVDEPPVFFTTCNGGSWVAARADLIEQAFLDTELFSSKKSDGGAGVPPSPADLPAFLPVESDGKFHAALRRPLNVALSPKGVNQLTEVARALAIELIEGLKPLGHCEFVTDFSLRMPMELFLRLVNLPLSDLPYLLQKNQEFLRAPDLPSRQAAIRAIHFYLDEWIQKRAVEPGDDLMSAVVTMQVEGRALTHRERLGYMATVLNGGLDTVGGMMAMTAKHLAARPDHRRQLRENPEQIPEAVNEFLRRFSSAVFARTVMRDTELAGVSMKKGDRITLPTMLHSLDDRRWDDALAIQLDRRPHEHLAFAVGPHKCPGAGLARLEMKIFLEEWLKRIPDFSVDPDQPLEFEAGHVVGLKALPLIWPTN